MGTITLHLKDMIDCYDSTLSFSGRIVQGEIVLDIPLNITLYVTFPTKSEGGQLHIGEHLVAKNNLQNSLQFLVLMYR